MTLMHPESRSIKESEMKRIGSYIEQQFGIHMSDSKKVLIENRLAKRLKELNFEDYGEYFDYLLANGSQNDEWIIFIDLVTTHETRFFRESGHFHFLYYKALPELLIPSRSSTKPLRILSAACSSGEEAYSIACIMEEYKRNNNLPNLEYEIIGTDISEIALDTACKAVYPQTRIENVPIDFLHRYFLRSKNRNSNLVRVAPVLRERVEFYCLNLMQDKYFFHEPFDIIFCCNVFIYFRKTVQETICKKLLNNLNSWGYFLIGHSESLIGCDLPLKFVSPAVYRKKKNA